MRGIFLSTAWILLLLIPVAASPSFQAEEISLVTHLKSGFSLPSPTRVIVNTSLFPKTTQTQHANPSVIRSAQDFQITRQDQESIVGFWTADTADISIDTQIRTRAFRKALQSDAFHIGRLPEGMEHFLTPTSFVTSDDAQIQSLAYQLTKDYTNLPEAVHNLASWVRTNINYDLSTLTEDISQNASWVLQHRQGVCDELTVLFLALTRAAGIPSRYVTGMVYTENSAAESPWISHAWAEVYFPETGWVPYDLTFGQFGWLDASHIVAKVSDTVDAPAVSFTWSSKDELVLVPLEISAEILEQKQGGLSPLGIAITPLLHGVSTESIVPIKVQVSNPTNIFQVATILLRKSPQALSNAIQPILLKPNSVLEFYYLVKTSEIREEHKAVIQIEDNYGMTAQAELQVSDLFPKITREAANTLIQADAYPVKSITPTSLWKKISDHFS